MPKASKLAAIEPKSATPSRPKILVFGKAGSGKTWASLAFPSCYYIDTEGGADLDHYTDRLQKSGGKYYGPKQGSQSFKNVIEQVEALATEDHEYKTLVIDSISHIYNIEIAKEATKLGDKDAFGASKKPATQLTRELLGWLDRIDMNVILICHEKALWADQKQIGVTFDAWEKVDYILHLALNISKQGSSRKAFVKKTRLQGFADGEAFDWNYEEFAKKFGKDKMEKKAEKLVLSTAEQLATFNDLLKIVKLDDKVLEKWLTAAGVEKFEDMDKEKMSKIILHMQDLLNKATGKAS